MPTTAQIPFSEPPYLQGLPSPYFTESHLAFQLAIRPSSKPICTRTPSSTNPTEPSPTIFRTFATSHLLLASLPAPLPITTGIWSDYASMAVRTGPAGSGAAGISLLLVPLKNHPGVTMRRLSVSGTTSSGTTYIELDDVRVPLGNLIGEENQGMRYIMTNFNHERLAVATGATRQARVALSTAFEYVMKREAFGKPLIDQPVVRHRLAKAGALLESLTAWVEQFAYMMTKLPAEKADILLGGSTALLKAQAGMVFKECADTAVLLFGWQWVYQDGARPAGRESDGECSLLIAALVLYREVMGTRIPGGSEDVLLDLAVRQLLKIYKVQTKMLEDSRGSKI
ncbi:hypothetical protein N0V88_005997 [Collariella sp. IMI 366227]|nr:hypothetical protein N0V88_005997 [Collariella sp. IMI 366227]